MVRWTLQDALAFLLLLSLFLPSLLIMFIPSTFKRPVSSWFFFFNDTATTEIYTLSLHDALPISRWCATVMVACFVAAPLCAQGSGGATKHADRKSTRLNSSHDQISYAVFCLKKKKKTPCV